MKDAEATGDSKDLAVQLANRELAVVRLEAELKRTREEISKQHQREVRNIKEQASKKISELQQQVQTSESSAMSNLAPSKGGAETDAYLGQLGASRRSVMWVKSRGG